LFICLFLHEKKIIWLHRVYRVRLTTKVAGLTNRGSFLVSYTTPVRLFHPRRATSARIALYCYIRGAAAVRNVGHVRAGTNIDWNSSVWGFVSSIARLTRLMIYRSLRIWIRAETAHGYHFVIWTTTVHYCRWPVTTVGTLRIHLQRCTRVTNI
jgi:hypothetical protein